MVGVGCFGMAKHPGKIEHGGLKSSVLEFHSQVLVSTGSSDSSDATLLFLGLGLWVDGVSFGLIWTHFLSMRVLATAQQD
jgi:hypothetical protein